MRGLLWGALLVLAVALTAGARAQERLTVLLDPLTPFIDAQGEGLSRELFTELGRVTGIVFEVRASDYDRAKLALRRGTASVVGHIARGRESDAFYTYAVELAFSYPAVADLYVRHPDDLADLSGLKVGTLRGNRQLAADATGLRVEQFLELSSLENLFTNLLQGRLDAVWFERASSLRTIERMSLRQTLFYRRMPLDPVPISYAVARNAGGLALKRRLDRALQKLDWRSIFSSYQPYLAMPDEGWTTPDILHRTFRHPAVN